MNLLHHIAQSLSLLRKSEVKVANYVLHDPAAVMHISMADLAAEVGVSEPTIVRFCRAVGCQGFQDLKLKLAQSLAAGATFGQFSISENDAVTDYALKIFDAPEVASGSSLLIWLSAVTGYGLTRLGSVFEGIVSKP